MATLQDQINELQAKLERLRAAQARCPHKWGDIRYAPRETGGYKTKPMHWHPGRECADIYVAPQSHPRWARTCETCGVAQHTERTEDIPRRGQLPGTQATEQVPVF